MSHYNEILSAKKNAEQSTLEEKYKQLNNDLFALQETIRQLKIKRHVFLLNQIQSDPNNRDEIHRNETTSDEELLSLEGIALQTKNYLETLPFKKTLCFKTNKLGSRDIGIMKVHADILSETLSQTDRKPSKPISDLLAEVKSMSYNPSRATIWKRRAGLLLASLACAAIVTVVIAALMTPGVNVLVAVAAVPMTLKASAAFFGLCAPAVIHSKINMGLFKANVSIPEPSTAATSTTPLAGGALTRQFSILNKPREIAARESRVAVTRYLADNLLLTVKNSGAGDDIKRFLTSVIEKASLLSKEGSAACFYERKQAKMKKAHDVLSTVATLTEYTHFAKLNIQQVQNRVVVEQNAMTFSEFVSPRKSNYGKLFATGLSRNTGIAHIPSVVSAAR